MKKIFILFLLAGLCFPLTPNEEKQLLRDIAEIKATLKMFMRETDKRFEQIDKRFEQVDRRIDELRQDMNARFEQIENDLNRLVQIMIGIFAGQFGLVAAVIAFAWWDRRTIIREAKRQTIEEIERETKPEKFKKVLYALRDKAKTDKELEEILKKYGLL